MERLTLLAVSAGGIVSAVAGQIAVFAFNASLIFEKKKKEA